MQRNLNLSIYNLLDFVFLVIAGFAFVNVSNTDVKAEGLKLKYQGSQGYLSISKVKLI